MLDVLQALGAALRLDIGLFASANAYDAGIAAGIALLAGISTMLGHLAILALNRITGLRLVASMLLTSVSLAFLYASQAAVTWGVATVVLDRPLPLLPLILVSLVSLAPLTFNVVTITPYVGLGIARLLQAWSYLILWLGIGVTFRVQWPWALGFTLAGWVVMQLLARLMSRPLNWVSSRLWTLATGRPTMVTSKDILSGTPFIPLSGGARPDPGVSR